MASDVNVALSGGTSSAESSFAGASIGRGGGHTINTIFNKGGQNKNSTSSGGQGQGFLYQIGYSVVISLIVGFVAKKIRK